MDFEPISEDETAQVRHLNTRIRIQEALRTHAQNWFEWIYDQLYLPEASSLLDLGCGPADLWILNLYRLPQSWQILLSDLSLPMIKTARESPLVGVGQFTCVVSDASNLPFRAVRRLEDKAGEVQTTNNPADPSSYTTGFDAVLAIGLLDLVQDRAATLQEIKRVLKPEGHLYASAGGQAHLKEMEDLVKPFLPEVDYGGDPNRFGLQNGQAILSDWFSNVERYDYQDELVFTEPGSLLAYALSEKQVREGLAGELRLEFFRFLEREFSRRGEVRVTNHKGLFKAIDKDIGLSN
jgi:SAM-dependent methyltransferase